MQEIDAIQNKRESKIISSINNDTAENGHIVFDYREKSGYRNSDTEDWLSLTPLPLVSYKKKECRSTNLISWTSVLPFNLIKIIR